MDEELDWEVDEVDEVDEKSMREMRCASIREKNAFTTEKLSKQTKQKFDDFGTAEFVDVCVVFFKGCATRPPK